MFWKHKTTFFRDIFVTSETKKRIFSAIVMIGLFFLFFSMGGFFFFFFTTSIALLIMDEILCNFLRKKRFSFVYFLIQFLLLAPLLYCHCNPTVFVVELMNILACMVNLWMAFYLLFSLDSSRFVFFKYPCMSALFVLLPFISLGSVMHQEKGEYFLVLLLVVNYSMDTGAWFFGKMLGRRKLCPSISPNKTTEGLMGGVMTAVLAGGSVYYFIFEKISLWSLFGSALLGLISQIGDLIQSKLKRQFHLKDSSSLIPGHGGVYDRMDSLVFSTPFVALGLDYYN